MRFEKTFVSREHRYSLGVEMDSGVHDLAIPVSNQMVDYIEYYKLTDEEYEVFADNDSRALEFAYTQLAAGVIGRRSLRAFSRI